MFGSFGKSSKDGAPPPPMPPPQDPPLNLSSDNDDEEHHRDESTPLIRHASRKTEPKRPSSSQAAMHNQLSTITDNSYSKSPIPSFESDDDKSVSSYSIGEGSIAASVRSLATVSLENFREGLSIPFYDESGSKQKIIAGLGSLCLVGTFLGIVMPKNIYLRGKWYPYYRWFSSIIGYNYFVMWSICFYPQVLLNYRRKSTQGLSNDFAILNFMGWSFYSAYLVSMYFDDEIKQMYAEKYKGHSSTVASNDVAFSVHAMILSFIYLVQIVYYGEGAFSFHLKPATWVLVLGMGLPSIIMALLIQTGIWSYSRWLDYFYMLSYFKICCTLTKYSKQVMLNFKRKSTSGWNIWYNFLECSGGSLSMLQIVFDSIDMQNPSGITGNFAKFLLGFATIFFDGIFFTQHYILYPHKDESSDADDAKKVGSIPVLIRATSLTQSGGHVRTNSRFVVGDGLINTHHHD